jgi:diguanylate cyclase (GGDEF)-like protein/PAS domain S-box-containing protein
MGLEATASLLRVSQSALRGVPWDYLVRNALEHARRITSCDVAAFYSAARADGTLTLYAEVHREGGIDALTPTARFLEHVASFDGRQPQTDESPGRHDVALAVRTSNQTYGILAISRHDEPFTLRDQQFTTALGEILAMALRLERQKRVAAALRRQSEYSFEYNPNAMFVLDDETFRYIGVNRKAIEIYGYTRDQILEMTPYDLRAPGHMDGLAERFETLRRNTTTQVDTVHRRADGSLLDVHISSITVEGPDGKIRIATVQDMTERNVALARALQSEAQLAHDAVHDRLTGLPNRKLLNERLGAAVELAHESGEMVAVLFIDVDDFKVVNDTMGHPAGDTYLKEIADRLRASIRRLDCIARVGGDEFIAVLGGIRDITEVADIVRHIELVAADPVHLPGGDMSGTCSIGVAVFPRDGNDAETLIHNADTAMYQSKRDGRARSCFFTPAMQHEAEQRVRLEARLRKALEGETFRLAYQPIYTFDGALCGTEALIRWPQPDGTVVAPSVFIPYAEACGLIIPIGTWVLRTACRQNAAWNLRVPNLCMSVNVSAKQLADPHFVRTVRRALLDSGLAPELLELELTETAMSTNAERTTAVIEELRGFGVRVAIDDFGTGYNTLATLRSNVVDTLKLDICFVTGIATSAVDQAIASTVITAAHGLGAKVVAEGVETLAQRAMLAKLECDAAQGFLFARPMSPADFETLLSADDHGSRSMRLGHLLERTG